MDDHVSDHVPIQGVHDHVDDHDCENGDHVCVHAHEDVHVPRYLLKLMNTLKVREDLAHFKVLQAD